MASVANINDVLEGHVALEVECVDRLLLNGYVPALQVGGQLVRFLCGHLGHPIWARPFAVAPPRTLEVAPLRVGCCRC